MKLATRDMAADIEAFQKAAYGRVAPLLGRTPIPLEWDYAEIFAECDVWYRTDATGLTGVLILRLRDDDFFLESIATTPHAAGTGVAGAMMDFAIEQARLAGRDKIRLITNAKNPAAEWYRKLGYAVEREEQLSGRTILHFIMQL